MCTPILECLNAQLLQLHDAVRSARLYCLDLGKLPERAEEEAEPTVFTASRMTQMVVSLVQEVKQTIVAAESWNHKTPEALKSRFAIATGGFRSLLKSLVSETSQLREATRVIGHPVDGLDPNPDFETISAELEIDSSLPPDEMSFTLASEQLLQYETDLNVRERVSQLVTEYLPHLKSQ